MFPTPRLLLAKKPPIGIFINARVLRDQMKREAFAENEQLRQALRYLHSFLPHSIPSSQRLTPDAQNRYISQNTTLPPRQRASAQLQLTTMHAHTRSTQFKNRCIVGGKGRGVFRDFRMARVSLISAPSCLPRVMMLPPRFPWAGAMGGRGEYMDMGRNLWEYKWLMGCVGCSINSD